MEKWQLAGIISGDTRSKLNLPSSKIHKASAKEPQAMRLGAINRAMQEILRKMTEVIALF